MRFQVLGAGGIGGGLGGLLQRAGHELTFVARGPHLRALRSEGLLLRTPRWQERLTARTAERVEGEGVVLLAVKSQHTAQVCLSCEDAGSRSARTVWRTRSSSPPSLLGCTP